MLAAFLVVAVGAFYALRVAFEATGIRGHPGANLAFVLGLLAVFVPAQVALVRTPFADLGLRRLARWSRLERLYALQVIPPAAVIFAIVFRDHLLALVGKHGTPGFMVFSVLTGVAWGIVQELLYRGWLQTELVRRFGPPVGVLAANAAFTFGPLHFDQLLGADGVRWGFLAAVFATGLFFGILYRRSGNLWIPAVLHGLWPLNMA